FFSHSITIVTISTIAYSIIFVLALVNNIIVLTVVQKFPPMKSVTNYFIANLASADLFVTFLVLPFTLLSNILTEWHFGWFLCKVIPYMQAVSILISINTLSAVAIERFCAIMYPVQVIITRKVAMYIIVVIWILPACIQIPWIFFYRILVDRGMTRCTMDTNDPNLSIFILAVIVVFYVLPLLLMSLLYAIIAIKVCRRDVSSIRGSQTDRMIQASKTHVIGMLMTVTFVFALSWLPLYILQFRNMFYSSHMNKNEFKAYKYIVPFAKWLGSANSSINPLIYCYFSKTFR
ncbi:hypothetical protein HELRODRAFT_120633, partial [Helobdella robusta]|uniref:G-protein coupled receptors family 1 profile domain-containing protein n=1 Tax=Helobdella robusta TaxID=6412 RepID=T1EGQ3_HELRO